MKYSILAFPKLINKTDNLLNMYRAICNIKKLKSYVEATCKCKENKVS